MERIEIEKLSGTATNIVNGVIVDVTYQIKTEQEGVYDVYVNGVKAFSNNKEGVYDVYVNGVKAFSINNYLAACDFVRGVIVGAQTLAETINKNNE